MTETRKEYKAVFFDRDGTLTFYSDKKEQWRNETISRWSGKVFELTYDKMMALFRLASEGQNCIIVQALDGDCAL